MVTGLSEVPSGNPITITLDLDLDGILQVTAKEKNTGLTGSLTIENAMKKRNKEDIEQAKNKIDAMFDSLEDSDNIADSEQHQSSDIPGNKTIVKAQALVEKAERMMDSLSNEDKEDMVDLIESIHDAIEANDMAKLSETEEELTDMIYYMEA